MPSRRETIASVAGVVTLTAGCSGDDDPPVRCSSRGVASESEHLRQVAVLRGDERVALGVVVSRQAARDDRFHAIRIRDAADELVASIPLFANRDMSRLEHSDYGILTEGSGELYAVSLGRPPVHGEFTVALVDTDGEPLATSTEQFNCYTATL
ncbi:hypothetical protein RYH80_15790 [Halobaculum sp. MBLA0147]|uniref:hypothetical protein n=1 Tax=Halobaculum sp. MBLA0147 TaxID=3079934 RepID=UPI003525AE76